MFWNPECREAAVIRLPKTGIDDTPRQGMAHRFLNVAAMRRVSVFVLAILSASAASAQETGWRFGGNLRVRQEAWDWFRPTGDFQNAYTFTGIQLRYGSVRTTSVSESQFEIAAPALLGLPNRASAPAPQGGLGLGSLYRAFNRSTDASVFVKQAYYKDKRLGIRVGRFEFGDGTETLPSNPVLAWVKSQRVAQRLIGTFAWTHVGRSFDGVHGSRSTPSGNLTWVAAFPTQGVFDVNGQKTLGNVRFAYGAQTKTTPATDQRLFAVLYDDTRRGVVKVDNRASASTDRDPVRLVTVGAHSAVVRGAADFLAWGAVQTGDWGVQRHMAHALALEAGWRPGKARHGLWLRSGVNVFSGDRDPADGTHGTFYPLLNTPRLYARTPFYGESNLQDIFVMAMLRPTPRTMVRADWHHTALDRTADRWYAAGGPFLPSGNFGLIGRPNPSGSRSIAQLIDIGVEQTLDQQTSVSAYLGWMRGGGVVRGIYPDGSGLMGFLEFTRKL